MSLDEIIESYVEEASFLWETREAAATAPDYDLDELSALDEKLEAQIDGLRIAGEQGLESALDALSWEGPGEIFTASLLALEMDKTIDPVLDILTKPDDRTHGLISALTYVDERRALKTIRMLSTSDHAALFFCGLGAMIERGLHSDETLSVGLEHPHPLIRARACRGVGQLGRTSQMPKLRYLLDDPECCYEAAYATALLGSTGGLPVLERVALSGGPETYEAMSLIVGLSENKAEWLQSLAKNETTARAAIIGAHVLGDPQLLPLVLDGMSNPLLARISCEAFCSMMGLDPEDPDFEGEAPEDDDFGPNDDPEDERVDLDPDEALIWPNPAAYHSWWEANQSQQRMGLTFLGGYPYEKHALLLRVASQRHRGVAALYRMLRGEDTQLFPTTTWVGRQKTLINALEVTP